MRCWKAGVALFWVVAAGMAHAGEAGRASPEELQRMHFRRAKIAYRTGHFKKALAEFELALKAKHHPVILFNIAQCHRQLGHYDKALFFYKLYLSEWPKAKNRALVERLIQKMRRLVQNYGRISVVTKPPGALVFLDDPKDKPIGRAPVSVKAYAGLHVVYATLEGYEPEQRVVAVQKGRVVAVTLELRPLRARQTVGYGQIFVQSEPPGAQVRIDNPNAEPVGRTPLTVRVPVGTHLLYFSLEGYEMARRVVTVASDLPTQVAVRLSRAEGRTFVISDLGHGKYAVRVVAKRQRARTTLGKWSLGLGVTAVLLSIPPIVTGALALTFYLKWKETSSVDDARRAHDLAVATDALFGAAAAVAAGALVTHIVDRVRRKRRKERFKAWLAPSCGSAGCGLVVGGSF